jgi:predicted nucleic acid-binding protein
VTTYFDTSAIVKLLIDEDGSPAASGIWRESPRRFATVLAYPEAMAALGAARRSKRITPQAERRATRALERELEHATLIEVGLPLAEHAGLLAADYGLRGYDAVHLATAINVGRGTVFVTWDRALRRAASNLGLPVSPP